MSLKYLSKQNNGFNTRNNFIRSMNITPTQTVETALDNYNKTWFSSVRKQYLNESFKHVLTGSLFWPKHVLADMLDEIAMSLIGESDYDDKTLMQDIDRIKSKILVWASPRKNTSITADDVLKEIRSFESKYKYACPDTFRTCWMNTGAYITLSYCIKYENLTMPNKNTEESLNLLKKLALEVLADMDHNVDTRLFKLCHALYKDRLNQTFMS